MSASELEQLDSTQESSLLGVLGESDDDCKVLVSIRSGKRQSVTKTLKSIEKGPLDIIKCEFYLDKLRDLLTELNSLDEKINSFMLHSRLWSSVQYHREAEVDEKYSDGIRLAIKRLTRELTRLSKSAVAAATPSPSTPQEVHHSYHKITLPSIELPYFDGNPAAYHKFVNSFESLLSKYDLSSFEQFSYLSKQLTGPAKKLVDSLALKDLNYESAKKLLDEAFSDKLSQQYSVIKGLCKLSLDPNARDGYQWISEARVLEEQVRSLDIKGDLFVQYFLWESLCDGFKSQLVSITNKSKPSLKEILDNLFEANNRFMDLQSNMSEKTKGNLVKQSSNAVSVCYFQRFFKVVVPWFEI
ncbi:uncharacterized protein LOC135203510 [Macrobrachium nipponense]|uniref:uncharacterized protein LOC135203510 n=1 Tax=Macrobrachium nipponense TaxID=159736 RepID=UPI0030C7DAAC